MERKRKATLTVRTAEAPVCEEREIEDIPVGSPRRRWDMFDWRKARRILKSGKAFSVVCPAEEFPLVRQMLVAEFENDCTIELVYDSQDTRLWAWTYDVSPFHVSHCELI